MTVIQARRFKDLEQGNKRCKTGWMKPRRSRDVRELLACSDLEKSSLLRT
jgi:hypothetical protein